MCFLTGLREVVDRLMTNLLLVKGAVGAGTDVVEFLVLVVCAVGALGAVDVVVAPLVPLFLYIGIVQMS